MTREIVKPQKNGLPMLFFFIFLFLLFAFTAVISFINVRYMGGIMIASGIFSILLALTALFCMLGGLFTLEPNESAVLLLFGKYVGTEKTDGFHWANPLYTRKSISLRKRNFECEKLKVNDKSGNPIEISAVVVWKVEDTAEALFEVDDYIEYIQIQTESALRHMATSYPYDSEDDDTVSLRASMDEISQALGKEIQERVNQAGVNIIEARINHLAYAPEIAGAMLQRQQAEAVIAARTKIVDGATSMVEMALEQLRESGVVDLDEERKANMVSNLMVVLCSDKATQPVINTGSLY